MKRKIVKSTAYFIAIVLLILSVSGCSQNHTTNSGNSSSDITASGNNPSAENNFEPQTEHLSEVPDGYIGIYTIEDLKNSGYNTKGNYILMNDLDLSSVADWDGINNDAVFDGNNYTIFNLKSTKCGLFCYANSIKNLNVENIDITLKGENYDKRYLGGLACTASNIENCITNGKINVTVAVTGPYYGFIGGIVGLYENDDKIIKNCKSGIKVIYKTTSPLNSDCVIGGICGRTEIGENKTFENCEFFGTINAEDATVGGILGYNYYQNVKIDSCLNSGTISCNYSTENSYISGYGKAVGGIVGISDKNDIIIENCSNISDIVAKINIDEAPRYDYCFGGIIGKLASDSLNVRNCYNAGKINVEGDNKKIGAIMGSDRTDNLYIRNCAYLKNDSYGITSTNAMFANCKAMTENEMQDINNYPFDNINEWKDVKGSYPIHNATDENT